MILGVIREYNIQEYTFGCENKEDTHFENCRITDIRMYHVVEYWKKEKGNCSPVVNTVKTLKKHIQVNIGIFNIQMYRVEKQKPVHDDMIDATKFCFEMLQTKAGIFIAQNSKINPKKPKKKYKTPQLQKYGMVDITIKEPIKDQFKERMQQLKEEYRR